MPKTTTTISVISVPQALWEAPLTLMVAFLAGMQKIFSSGIKLSMRTMVQWEWEMICLEATETIWVTTQWKMRRRQHNKVYD